MARFADRSYSFATQAHWRAGAMRGFAMTGTTLTATQQLKAEKIEPFEAHLLAAPGPCGRLVWLRPATMDSEACELVVLHSFGAEPQGRITTRLPIAIYMGPTILWVHEKGRLRRFNARSLQELGVIEMQDLVAAASDGSDGLWVLRQSEAGTRLNWLDGYGRFHLRPIEVPEARAPRALACDLVRRRVAIVDAEPDGREWRLHLVDLASCKAEAPLVFQRDEKVEGKKAPLPKWIAVDDQGVFWLASSNPKGALIAVSAEGFEVAYRKPLLDAKSRVTGLLWREDLIVCTTDGLYRLIPATGDSEEQEGPGAVFVTPTLKSPPGTPAGWNRADIGVDLPKGARLTATIYATASPGLASQFDDLLADQTLAGTARLARIDRLFESHQVEKREQLYRGEGDTQQLHLLLDRIDAPYLWLKLEINCPPGAGKAGLRRLKVRYPDRSWLNDLPAIYREKPGPTAQLRQFLAPFEALFDEIDEAIDGLPAQIDPDTAGDARLSWLLGWLGFPPTTGLPSNIQRELLKAAGGLLERRGTIDALRELLSIVTGNNPVIVEDSAATAGFWIIDSGKKRYAPRLGRNTRVVARLPGGFRPGKGARLGEEPLPPFCTDIDRVLRRNCGLVTIRIALDPGKEAIVRPIVESLLAMFVPAHCRIELSIAYAGRTRPGGQLDSGWQLAGNDGAESSGTARLDDPAGIELGAETKVGVWRLPDRCPAPFTIDGTAALDGVRRLA
jgi:phage tail-like protein